MNSDKLESEILHFLFFFVLILKNGGQLMGCEIYHQWHLLHTKTKCILKRSLSKAVRQPDGHKNFVLVTLNWPLLSADLPVAYEKFREAYLKPQAGFCWLRYSYCG